MIRKYMPVIMVYPSHKKSYENALFKRHILPVYAYNHGRDFIDKVRNNDAVIVGHWRRSRPTDCHLVARVIVQCLCLCTCNNALRR